MHGMHSPPWSALQGANSRGSVQIHPGMGPDGLNSGTDRSQMDGPMIPSGPLQQQAGSWFPGMTPEQMMSANGYTYFYPLYPNGRGNNMMMAQAGQNPYAPGWNSPMGEGMMPPFLPVPAAGCFYGPVPPGMDLSQMMGMHMVPGFMGIVPNSGDCEEPQGGEVEGHNREDPGKEWTSGLHGDPAQEQQETK